MSDLDSGGCSPELVNPCRAAESTVSTAPMQAPVSPRKAAPPTVPMQASPFGNREAAWTAARCTRALRQFELRIQEIQDKQKWRPGPLGTAKDHCRDLEKECTDSRTPKGELEIDLGLSHPHDPNEFILHSDTEEEDDDPEWKPQVNRGKRLKVYVGRVLREAKKHFPNADDTTGPVWFFNHSTLLRGAQQGGRLGYSRGRESEMAYLHSEFLLRGLFQRMLVITQSSLRKPRSEGVPTLLSLCLMNVPE